MIVRSSRSSSRAAEFCGPGRDGSIRLWERLSVLCATAHGIRQ
jgi:hypothetical protein